jgi:hypothetical protein
MAQKSLFKNKKNPSQKAVAVNRHGKVAKTKKGTPSSIVVSLHCDADADSRSATQYFVATAGNLTAPPKKASLLKAYTDNKVHITGRLLGTTGRICILIWLRASFSI